MTTMTAPARDTLNDQFKAYLEDKCHYLDVRLYDNGLYSAMEPFRVIGHGRWDFSPPVLHFEAVYLPCSFAHIGVPWKSHGW